MRTEFHIGLSNISLLSNRYFCHAEQMCVLHLMCQVHWVLWRYVCAHGDSTVRSTPLRPACHGKAFRGWEKPGSINNHCGGRCWWLHWSLLRRCSTVVCRKLTLQYDWGSTAPGNRYSVVLYFIKPAWMTGALQALQHLKHRSSPEVFTFIWRKKAEKSSLLSVWKIFNFRRVCLATKVFAQTSVACDTAEHS